MSLATAEIRYDGNAHTFDVQQQEVNPLMPPEAELVLLCSRSHLDAKHIERVSEIIAQGFDSEFAFTLAYRNRVLPLVCGNLLERFSAEMTAEARETARELSRYHVLRNLSMTSRLLKVLGTLEAEGIKAVPFKGPTLAKRLYANTTLREFFDLDILLLPKDFDQAIDLLLENGYLFCPDSGSRNRELLRINRSKDVSLYHPEDRFRVELHWRLSGSFFSLPIHLQRLWDRMETTELGGVEVKTLPFKDLFVYLCLHAARHGFARLDWICDLHELIRTETNANWSKIREHARTHGCEKVVELAIFLVHDLFGKRVDYPEFERIEADENLAKIAAAVRDRLLSGSGNANGIGEWYGYHLMLKEKRSDRIKLHIFYLAWYLKLIFRPNAADKEAFPLPTGLYPLYLVLRPARLIYNYFSKDTPVR